MTPADLRALLAKATPGPWARGGIDDDCVLVPHLETDKGEHHVACYTFAENRDGDADFIVAARNSMDALVELAEAVERFTDDADKNNIPLDRGQIETYCEILAALKKLKAGSK